MRYQEFANQAVDSSVDEGVRDVIAGLALGAGVGLSPGLAAKEISVQPGDTVVSLARKHGVTARELVRINKLGQDSKIRVGQQLVIPQGEINNKPQASKGKTVTGTEHEQILTQAARSAGIVDPVELAAFLAQAAHETHDFRSLVEYGGLRDFRKYDIKYAPNKARTLGNHQPGDGARYRGRGYLQITGRYNYRRAGQHLGIDLEKHPELLSDPKIAAAAAIWFWKTRVRPQVDNFADVRSVTKPINPSLHNLDQRVAAFDLFKRFFS